MEDTFSPANLAEKPADSLYFRGETVLDRRDNSMWTVCALDHYDEGYYGVWPLGYSRAIPDRYIHSDHLEPLVELVETKLLAA
jgi:hypothetical protein